MAKAAPTRIKWLADVEAHDYPAARSYLSLLANDATVSKILKKLKAAPIVQFKSKDIFRASRLSLLGISNREVTRDRIKIEAGVRLSPLLLVRDRKNGRVVIADGYHRLCAVYKLDENALISCKIV